MALTTGDLAQLKAEFENMSVYGTPTVDNNMSVYNTPTVDNMSIYGVDGSATQTDNTIQQDQETGIAEILLPNTNTLSFNQNDGNNNYVNNNIDYSKLMMPINKIKNAYTFSKNPLLAGISTMFSKLPKRDSRQGALEDFYGDNFGLTSSGSVASGIMQGYNPVSGGFFGGETQYGLGPAMDKRIAKINQTLNKYDKYKYGSEAFDPKKYQQQIDKLKKLEKLRAAELAAQQEAKEQTAQQLRNAQEAAFAAAGGNRAAQDARRRADAATIAQANREYRNDPGAQSYSGGAHSADASGSTYSDPFDPGGGEKDGGYIDGTNRRRYGTGGIVTL